MTGMARGRLREARILVVDDDAGLRPLIREVLEAEGAIVRDCAGVAEALAVVACCVFDAVVSDVQMPGGGGVALYRAACARDPRLVSRFVFMTGDPAGADAREVDALTGCRLLGKPAAPDNLVEAVLEVVSH